MTKKRWKISVVNKLDGKFPQKSGPDKPGTECTVVMNDGSGDQHLRRANLRRQRFARPKASHRSHGVPQRLTRVRVDARRLSRRPG